MVRREVGATRRNARWDSHSSARGAHEFRISDGRPNFGQILQSASVDPADLRGNCLEPPDGAIRIWSGPAHALSEAVDSRASVRPPTTKEDWVLPFSLPHDRIASVTRIRSTLVASSLQALRERNLLDAYASRLPQEHREPILQSVAGSWLAIEAGVAHYRAMDDLGLMPTEIHEMGRAVAVKVQGTFLSTLAKLATTTGVTPWTPLEQLERIWGRVFLGGAVGVLRRGPKEAHCEIVGLPLLDVPYFRIALRGLIGGGLQLFASKAYVTEVDKRSVPQRAVYRLAWA